MKWKVILLVLLIMGLSTTAVAKVETLTYEELLSLKDPQTVSVLAKTGEPTNMSGSYFTTATTWPLFIKNSNGEFIQTELFIDMDQYDKMSLSERGNVLNHKEFTLTILNAIYRNYLINKDPIRAFSELLFHNPNTPYLAIHEMAQVLAASDLSSSGEYYLIQLEGAIWNSEGKHFEADIPCYSFNGKIRVYEVKPYGKSGIKQISKYTNVNPELYKAGDQLVYESKRVFDGYNLTIKNSRTNRSVLWYSGYDDSNNRIPNKEAVSIFRYVIGAAILSWLYGNDSTGIGALDDVLIPSVLDWLSQ